MKCNSIIVFIVSLGLSIHIFGGPINPFLSVIPADTLTVNRMESVMTRIQAYMAENHQLPQKLSDLPDSPIRDNGLTDGWDKLLVYAPQKDGSVILRSVGKDGIDKPRSIQFSAIGKPYDDYYILLLTFNQMDNLEGKIHHYAHVYGRLPNRLSDLDMLDDNIDDSAVNGWGEPIAYKPQSDGSVILSNKGKPSDNQNQTFSLQFFVDELSQNSPTTMPTQPRNSDKSQ